MKTSPKKPAVIAAGLGVAGIAGLMLAHAADTGSSEMATDASTVTISEELAAQLATIEQQPTIDATNVPDGSLGATYYSAQYPNWPGLPCNFNGLPVWSLGGNLYLLDDLGVSYGAGEKVKASVMRDGTLEPASAGGGGIVADYQTQSGIPYLTIAPMGTNAFFITVFNSAPGTYYLQMTPVLANTNYPWQTITSNGVAGQTNFTVAAGPFVNEFFRVLMSANNPGQGIAVFIDSPANGATVQ